MKAIYLKEMKGYMISMMGYLFIAFCLFIEGIYFVIYNMNAAYPEIGVTLSSVTFIFMIVVPLLTMRSIAEEKKAKTDQLLLTSPVSVSDIVWGKYLALLTLFGIPVLVTCIYPLIMSAYGEVDFRNSYVAVLGFFLLGAASLSIGLFVSSLTENPVIAAGGAFLIMFLCTVMSGLESYLPQKASTTAMTIAIAIAVIAALVYYFLRNLPIALGIGIAGEVIVLALYMFKATIFENALQSLAKFVEINSYFEYFENGILDLRGIVYYLSICGVFVFLTMQSIQKRRWS